MTKPTQRQAPRSLLQTSPNTQISNNEVQLLVAILHTTKAKLDYDAIAKYMGPECTKVAVTLRINRLKKQVKDASKAVSSGGDEGSSAPVIPAKRKKDGKAGSEGKVGGVKERPAKKAKTEEDEEETMETEESG
ncbi:hypothetical protein SI65_09247 [Aspergillus cristatus]|uniref:Uncharacterized protein n=1 Tax=Aspergillus cristatus TaxID=573508 RepID=A0A1E3B4E2_ASPCR|nr:hypothetical protein SI65_09247 [Aspergillus cristatus]